MLCYILTGVYCFIGVLLGAALLTDRHCNTNKKEALFCAVAGLVWPLAIGAAAGLGLFENVKEKVQAKRQARNEKLLRFAAKLLKMKIISASTMSEVQKRITN